MTPSFYSKYQIFNQIIELFNARCSCEKTAISIEFIQQLSTNDPASSVNACQNWSGSFRSVLFGDDTFLGTVEAVSNYFENRLAELGDCMIEAMIANANEWYSNKPDIKEKVNTLYWQIKGEPK
jgi:hypothetical protein